jgi:hypothetical protein
MKKEKWKLKNGTGICTFELLLRIINGGFRISEFRTIKERGVWGEGGRKGKWKVEKREDGKEGEKDRERENCVRGIFSRGNNIFDDDDDDGDS